VGRRRDPQAHHRHPGERHDLAAHGLRGLRTRGRDRRLWGPGNGHGRHLHGHPRTADPPGPHPPARLLRLGHPRLHHQRDPVRADRVAASGRSGRTLGILGEHARRIRPEGNGCGRGHSARLVLHGPVPDPGDGPATRSAGAARWRCGSPRDGLERDARRRLARRGAGAAASRATPAAASPSATSSSSSPSRSSSSPSSCRGSPCRP
jgi:hypothetical protein